MTSVIPPVPLARAPRTIRAKNSQVHGFKSKESLTAGSSLTFQTINEAASYLENFLKVVHSNPLDRDLKSAVLILCANLKAYGAQLEVHYKDQLDRVFLDLRNIGRDETLDKISRLHLLEMIELRASCWLTQDHVCSYYQAKLAELEATTTPDVIATAGQLSSTYGPKDSPPTSPLPLLQPGEVVKFSGKYNNTNNTVTTAQSKSFIKDEVVIRNADSGKVMGLKGKRVHLIEEISDTVISFQRVNPGAKERLVQITGPGKDNIERARQLIEQTIQRNASPVRQVEPSISTGTNPKEISETNRRDSTLIDAAFDEYQHSVVIGAHTLKILGSSLDLVQAAKLVLDEYFANFTNNRERTASSCSSTDDGVVMTCSSQESPRGSTVKKIPRYNRETLLMMSNSPICRSPPANFDLILQHAPEIARKPAETQNEQMDTTSLECQPEHIPSDRTTEGSDGLPDGQNKASSVC